jgi:hypothetical protein
VTILSVKINKTAIPLEKDQFANIKSGKHAKFKTEKNARPGCSNALLR